MSAGVVLNQKFRDSSPPKLASAGKAAASRRTPNAAPVPQLTISLFAMIGCGHENDALLLIDLTKEAPVAGSVAPRRRVPIFQSLDVRTGLRS